jgi:tripartite-type tricarboxylate transporter receptor subunit TctC
MKKGLFRALFACAAFAAVSATAQNYPSKPIHIVVPYTPSGGNDLYGRAIGQKLQQRLGQPVIIDNKPGAGGNIGAEFVARSAPDGYTIMVVQNGLTMVPWLTKSLPFDVVKDFAPIGIGVTLTMVVIVTNNLPVTSINELISYAKANPGKLSYGTPGVGTPHHLATEWFKEMTGTRMVHVPYKGASGYLTDLMSGQVQVVFGVLSSSTPLIRGGKIRAIALTSRERLAQFRELATVNESVPRYEVNQWYGLWAPAGTPDAIVNLLSEEQRAIVTTPETRDYLAGIGLDSNPTSAAEMRQIIAADLQKWGKVVKAAGIEPQ